MTRRGALVGVVLWLLSVGASLLAAEPPAKLTPEERKSREAKLLELNEAGGRAYRAGKYAEAMKAYEAALEVSRALYPRDAFPDGHANLAGTLNNLALRYSSQGKHAAAEPLLKEALEMHKRLFKGDHPHVATSLNNLGLLYNSQAKYAAAEPHYKDALAMRQRLFKGDHSDVANSLNNLGALFRAQGKLAEAEPLSKDALAMRIRLYKGDHTEVATSLINLAVLYSAQGKYAPAEQLALKSLEMRKRLYPGDHPTIAASMTALASLYWLQGKLTAAESLCKETLAMRRRLFKGDHPHVADSLHSFAVLRVSQGGYAEAESLHNEALAMKRRVFQGDHPDVADSLGNLAILLDSQGKFAAAEPFAREALAMRQRLYKGDHLEVAASLNILANVADSQGKHATAEKIYTEALAMLRRLFRGDHPATAVCLNNLGHVSESQGNSSAAESRYQEALAMQQRLFKGDHPDVAASLNNLAVLSRSQRKYAAAEKWFKDSLVMNQRLHHENHPVVALSLYNLASVYRSQEKYAAASIRFKEALATYRRFSTTFAREKPEGEALTLFGQLPQARDAFLCNERVAKADPAAVYPVIWFEKGAFSRVYETRQLQARSGVAAPKAAHALAELADARRRRAELLLAPATKDRDTQAQRDTEVKTYAERISALSRELRPLLPVIPRADRLAEAEPDALQQALPADAVLVDYLRFVGFEQDPKVKGKAVETPRYLAFVVTKDKITWVELDSAARIEAAVTAWRAAITSGKEIDPALPAKVRELVWQDVRQLLPATVKTVYLSPDAALCRVPFAALPGDKPGTILLDDFTLSTVPHAHFLLDRLWPQEPRRNPPTEALAVGGVQYDAEANVAAKLRGEPLVKEGAKLGWSFLPATVAEADGFLSTAQRQKLPTTRLDGDKATPAALLAALPKARLAHLATHGFFADPSVRGLFQLDEKDYEQSRRGERIGRVANSPLLMSGLVLAGANLEKTPGRGIVTGEALIDLDLSGLELAVLSACETGLGDVAGGEGTFSLQRAFHLAGTQNVLASLWKVPDEATAALMALFYRNLWDKKQPPIEALRQAQLELYRNPGRIAELAKGFRGKFVEVPGMGGEVTLKPNKDGTAHPLLWAAFSLSGAGR